MAATRPMPVLEGDRPGLQALLRGANEAVALLPERSSRRRAVEELVDGLAKILADEPHEEA